MKKFYFLIVFFGALLFCACDKDDSDLLIEDQAQTQLDDGALKGAKMNGKRHEVPFKAEFEQYQASIDLTNLPVFVDLTMEGEGKASHLGKTTLFVEQNWILGPVSEGAAKAFLTAANGDVLVADFYNYNIMEFDEFGNILSATVWGEGVFHGGTGRFENAEGSCTLSAFHDAIENIGTAVYKGSIKY